LSQREFQDSPDSLRRKFCVKLGPTNCIQLLGDAGICLDRLFLASAIDVASTHVEVWKIGDCFVCFTRISLSVAPFPDQSWECIRPEAIRPDADASGFSKSECGCRMHFQLCLRSVSGKLYFGYLFRIYCDVVSLSVTFQYCISFVVVVYRYLWCDIFFSVLVGHSFN